MPQVSFARDIRPLFRAVDISHMNSYGIKLDDYTFMSDPDNADKVLGTLSPNDDDPPSMPPGGRTSSRCSPSGRRTDTSRKPHDGYSGNLASWLPTEALE
jgi:hypothetical protein